MKVLSVLKYVFSLVGILVLLGALAGYKSTKDFLSEAVSTSGVVVDFIQSRNENSVTYKPVVQFVAQGGQTIEFPSSVSSNPPAYSVGEQVEVLYSRLNPQEAKINVFFDLWGGALVMAVLGGAFFSVGALMFLVGRLKKRKKEYLQHHGVTVEAKFQSVEWNQRISVNGRNPFVIVCQWLDPATSVVHVFESENIWFDPSDYIENEHVNVLIKKGNPEKYHVDISFLPKMAR